MFAGDYSIQSEHSGHNNGAAQLSGRNTGEMLLPLFEEGYNDKILMHEGQLDNWKHYLDDNPRRPNHTRYPYQSIRISFMPLSNIGSTDSAGTNIIASANERTGNMGSRF